MAKSSQPALQMFHHTALIATVILAASVLSWMGGSKFGFDGPYAASIPLPLACSDSPRHGDPGKESLVAESAVTPPEAARPTSWEAAAVTGLRWLGLRDGGDDRDAALIDGH
jgi:hypothetical protein